MALSSSAQGGARAAKAETTHLLEVGGGLVLVLRKVADEPLFAAVVDDLAEQQQTERDEVQAERKALQRGFVEPRQSRAGSRQPFSMRDNGAKPAGTSTA